MDQKKKNKKIENDSTAILKTLKEVNFAKIHCHLNMQNLNVHALTYITFICISKCLRGDCV